MNNKIGDNSIEVTVICVTFNHEPYIEQALESLINQTTNFQYEIVVYDDASTDGTANIIRKYAKKYPELIYPIYEHQNQYSQGINAETLIKEYVKGDYVAYCEGDDFWCDEQKLQQQYNIMKEHPECSICTHKVNYVNVDGTLLDGTVPRIELCIEEGVLNQEEMAMHMFRRGGYPFHTTSYFMRKNAWELSIDNSIPYNMYIENRDIRMLYAALITGDCYYINRGMSCFRKNVPNSWNDRMSRETKEYLENLKNRDFFAKVLFDEYTGHRYHKYIITTVHEWIIKELCKDQIDKETDERVKQLLKAYSFTIKNIMESVSSRKSKRHRLLWKFCPWVIKQQDKKKKDREDQ